MIILSAGCVSLALLMRDADRSEGGQTKRAPIENDRCPRPVSSSDYDQRAVCSSPARQIR